MLFEKWFTNKCEALVGEDGRALEGEALKEALRQGNARHCGHLVVIGANYCSRCGALAPGSWWNCAQCGRRIGSESNNCPYCGADQAIALRKDLENGIWKPNDDIFAERFELNSYKQAMDNGLQIQPGQAAILLDGGVVIDVLKEGHHPLADIANFKGADETGKSRSLFFVRQGEMDFPLRLSGLISKEQMPAELTMRAIIEFDCAKAEDFLKNLMCNSSYMKGGPLGCTLPKDSIAFNLMLTEADLAAQAFCSNHTIDDLFQSPQLRISLRDEISNALEKRLASFGFCIKRLAELEFHGEIFERLRKERTHIETMRRELEYQLEADAYIKDHQRRDNQKDAEQEEYLKNLAKEMEVKDQVRDRELQRLKEQNELEQKIADLEAKFQQAKKYLDDTSKLEALEQEYKQQRLDIEQNSEQARKKKEHDYKLQEALAAQQNALEKAKLQSEIDKLKNEQSYSEQMRQIRIRQEQQEIETKILRERIAALNDAKIETLVFMAQTPAQQEQLKELHEITLKSKMTAEQLLAYGASSGKTAASDAIIGSRNQDTALLRQENENLRREVERLREQIKDNQQFFEHLVHLFTQGNSSPTTGSTTQNIHFS